MRISYVKFLLGCLVTVALTGTAGAQNRLFSGSRNLGMGNTGVGASQDALAVHFNPAGMAFNHGWEIQLPLIAADVQVGGPIFDDIDDISSLFVNAESTLDEIQARFDDRDATPEDLKTVLDTFLYELPDIELGGDNGGTGRVFTGPAFRWKNWGISTSILGNGGVDTTLDLESGLAFSSVGLDAIPTVPNACAGDQDCLDRADALVSATGIDTDEYPDLAETLVAAAGESLADDDVALAILEKMVLATIDGGLSLGDNESAIITTTALAAQVAFTYSHLIYQDKLSVGGNFRVMQGSTRAISASVNNIDTGRDTFEDSISDITDRLSTKTSTEVGIDLGVMYRPWEKFSVGLTAENINTPTFDFEDSFRTFELQPRARAGVAYRPFKWFNVAADLDLNEVDSQVIRDFGYQYANIGVEFLAGRWFSGWLGTYANFAAEDVNPTYTGGAGFGIGRFQISLSLAASSDTFTIARNDEDDLKLPTGAAASIMLAWREKKLPKS